MSDTRILYSYWRSSAAYRVRIALNLMGLDYDTRPVHLVQDGGQQHHPAYRTLNPQELVPTLIDGKLHLTQSMAIIEYLDERYGGTHRLMPDDAGQRARVRALAQVTGCDIHPIGNLRVLQYLGRELGAGEDARKAWSRHWIETGFQALETMLYADQSATDFCHGKAPGLADICLVPQVYNARRWGVDMHAFPTIARIDAHCMALPAFQQASPEQQPDAPQES